MLQKKRGLCDCWLIRQANPLARTGPPGARSPWYEALLSNLLHHLLGCAQQECTIELIVVQQQFQGSRKGLLEESSPQRAPPDEAQECTVKFTVVRTYEFTRRPPMSSRQDASSICRGVHLNIRSVCAFRPMRSFFLSIKRHSSKCGRTSPNVAARTLSYF